MSKEFVKRYVAVPKEIITNTDPKLRKEDLGKTIQLYTSFIEFFRSENQFPNGMINNLFELVSNVIDDKRGQVIIDPESEDVISTQAFYEPNFILIGLPVNLVDMYHEDPVFTMAAVVEGASHARDFCMGKDFTTDESMTERSQVFLAEFFLTWQQMARDQGRRFFLGESCSRVKEALRKYSQGVTSSLVREDSEFVQDFVMKQYEDYFDVD